MSEFEKASSYLPRKFSNVGQRYRDSNMLGKVYLYEDDYTYFYIYCDADNYDVTDNIGKFEDYFFLDLFEENFKLVIAYFGKESNYRESGPTNSYGDSLKNWWQK